MGIDDSKDVPLKNSVRLTGWVLFSLVGSIFGSCVAVYVFHDIWNQGNVNFTPKLDPKTNPILNPNTQLLEATPEMAEALSNLDSATYKIDVMFLGSKPKHGTALIIDVNQNSGKVTLLSANHVFQGSRADDPIVGVYLDKGVKQYNLPPTTIDVVNFGNEDVSLMTITVDPKLAKTLKPVDKKIFSETRNTKYLPTNAKAIGYPNGAHKIHIFELPPIGIQMEFWDWKNRYVLKSSPDEGMSGALVFEQRFDGKIVILGLVSTEDKYKGNYYTEVVPISNEMLKLIKKKR